MSAKHRVSQIILLFREYNRINGKTCCVDIACTPLERKDDIRVRYIKLDYRIYLFK